MHDVEGHLAVIDARDVHPHLPSPPATWAESSAASPRTTTRPLPKGKARPCARPAAEPGFRSSTDGIDRGVGQLEDGDAPLRALERRAGEGLTRLTRSESSRPRVIGWSPRRWFWRVKTRLAGPPSEFDGSDGGPLAHVHAESLRQALGGRAHRGVVGDEQQGAAVLDPVADGVALGVGERRIRRLGLAHPSAPSALAMTRMSPFSSAPGELLLVGDDLVAVVGDQLGERLVAAAGGVEVVMGLVEEDPRMSGRVGRPGSL